MMKRIKHIFLMVMTALLLTGCHKETIDTNTNDIPEGYVKVEIDMDAYFGAKELTTRADDTAIATMREAGITNAYICVFQNTAIPQNDKLLQFEKVIRDINSSGVTYYAVLEEELEHVILHGLSNIDQATIDKISAQNASTKEYTISRQGFYTEANIEYSNASDAVILRNSTDGLLPKFTKEITLDELTIETIATVKAETLFSYARIDVVMPTSSEFPVILGTRVVNAPTYPAYLNSLAVPIDYVVSHEITPQNNQPVAGASASSDKWPTPITDANETTKFAQGLYMYPTAIAASDDISSATYIIIRARKDESSPADGTYYKILMRHRADEFSEYSYDIQASHRYLVRVSAINTDGYSTLDEAIAAPPSNIIYEIDIDDNSTSIVTNGQYYIGADKSQYYAAVNYSSQSNMMYKSPEIITESNLENFVINPDETYSMDFEFTINPALDGGADVVNPSDLEMSIDLPVGIVIDNSAGAGYNTDSDWKNSFGRKKLRLTTLSNSVGGDFVINVGELTLVSTFAIGEGIVTDYTNEEFVNELTGLASDYGGNSGLRLANSYICAPYQTNKTVYYIPVTDRVNDFWSNHASGTDANKYSIPTENWTNNSAYTVETAWYDGGSITGLELEKSYSPSGKNAIMLTLPPAFNNQNILVAVKYNDVVIWSWHIWVTNYNPYYQTLKETGVSAKQPLREELNQVADVIGGQIHSYSGTSWWHGEIYADKFIMDRNIGASAATYSGQGANNYGAGFLVYQFGRKDPFPGATATYTNGYSLLAPRTMVSFGTAVNTPTTINAATDFRWTYESIASSLSAQWFDKNLSTSDIVGKSIFDPSPLGYRVPVDGVWDILQGTVTVWGGDGRTYNNSAYYPAIGYRDVHNGVTTALGVGIYRTAIPARSGTSYTSYGIRLDSTSLVEGLYSHGAGFSVRAVQE